jgi:hypothetical protein
MDLPKSFVNSFDVLHEAAIARTGLTDFGPAEYQQGLRQVLGGLDEDTQKPVADRSRKIVAGMLTGVLVARLLTQEGWKRNPGYLQVKIQKPLIIVGLPRTGSTVLHKLLAVDPQFQGVPLWLYHAPMVRPPRNTWESNPWYLASRAGIQNPGDERPVQTTNHDMSADAVDECIWGLQQNFVEHLFSASFGSITYEAWWWRQQSEMSTYRRYVDLLRLIGLGDTDRRWLLKYPGHLFHMDALFEVFPDACVIQTHRDPAKSMISSAHLAESAQRSIFGDKIQPLLIGASESYKWLHGVLRAEQVRHRHEDKYFDVRHVDFLRDPMREVEKIYHRFGLELSDTTAAHMRRWLAAQVPEQKNGPRYSAEAVGLREDGLREMFRNYIDRYGLK